MASMRRGAEEVRAGGDEEREGGRDVATASQLEVRYGESRKDGYLAILLEVDPDSVIDLEFAQLRTTLESLKVDGVERVVETGEVRLDPQRHELRESDDADIR
jgi:hypothetical protein